MDDDGSCFTVLHIPHSSRTIPDGARERFELEDEELETESIRLADLYTDEIFDLDGEIAKRIVFGYSRMVVDVERFLNDDYEAMAGIGMGAFYLKTTDGRHLRTVDDDYRNELIETYYKPHHGALTEAVDALVGRNGYCLILDCHSFPSVPLPCEPDKSPNRPEICIGTDDFHTPPDIAEAAIAHFNHEGFNVELNRPYSGALVPMEYFGNDKRVLALMIEVNRSLYMNETTGEKLPGFDELASKIRRICVELIEAVRDFREEIENR